MEKQTCTEKDIRLDTNDIQKSNEELPVGSNINHDNCTCKETTD